MEHLLLADPKLNFMNRIGSNGNGKNGILLPEKDYLLDIITSEVSFTEVLAKLTSTKQDKINVREIILESENDFLSSVKQLKKVFNDEFTLMTNKLNEKFNQELLKIKQLYHIALIGQPLIDLVNALSPAGWVLVMKDNSVNLYKCYNPPFEVFEGVFESGDVYEYDEPVCQLLGIYVNIMHPNITTGTIKLSTDGKQHPNCSEKRFGSACPGTLDEREITLNNIPSLLTLLTEISTTYESMHMDSAYYQPSGSYSIRKENESAWTT
jgi:hypothetical protein